MYVTNEQSKTPIFQINQHIGFDKDILGDDGSLVQQGDGQGIDGIIFANEVLGYNDADLIELIFYINSQGGDVQRSLDMFNAISMSKQKTHAIITGFAFSCAGWIPLAADKVDMVEETGRWMCHMPYNPEDPEEQSQFMDEVVDIISKTIASKSGRNGKPKKTQDEVKRLMKEKTYWDAERMFEEGLIDRIVNSGGKVVRLEKDPIVLNKSELNYYYKEYQVALNKEIKEIETKTKNEQLKLNNMPFPKVVNRLNAISKEKTGVGFSYAEDVSEEEIVSAIAKLENRLRAMNDDMMDKDKYAADMKSSNDDMMNKMSEAKKLADDKAKEASDAMCQYNEMKEAHDKLHVENTAMKSEKEAADNKAKELDLKLRTDKATNFVDKLISDKKVFATGDKSIDKIREVLINKATEDFDSVELQFSFQPIKISAPKPKFASKNQDTTGINIMEKLKSENVERIKSKQFRTSNGVKVNLFEKENA